MELGRNPQGLGITLKMIEVMNIVAGQKVLGQLGIQLLTQNGWQALLEPLADNILTKVAIRRIANIVQETSALDNTSDVGLTDNEFLLADCQL